MTYVPIALVAMLYLFSWSLCWIAKQADERMERNRDTEEAA